MGEVTKSNRWQLSVTVVYAIIVLEILFMVSPAALYYYSVYGLPLNWLSTSPWTSWLVQYVLPHYTATTSWTSNILITISWPLILLGLMIFLWGFIQIYWAKFTHKGEVVGGIYHLMRHPQYVGLAVMGLGTCLFWSRFIVLLTYVTMLFLYYLLARDEEQRCLEKYGQPYRHYLENTSGFIPGFNLTLTPKQLALIYPITLVLVLGGGWWLKLSVLQQMLVLDRGTSAPSLVLAPIEEERAEQVLSLAAEYLDDNAAQVRYLAPASWSVPELGLQAGDHYQISAGAELAHPTMHGNVPDYQGDTFNLLVTTPQYRSSAAIGFEHLIAIEPEYLLHIDLATGEVSRHDNLAAGRWSGIPVPVY